MEIFYIGKNSWIHSSRNINFSNNMLEAELEDCCGNWHYNKIEIHDSLLNKDLINENGTFKYKLSGEEDSEVMNNFFPFYNGAFFPEVTIQKCVILSVDIEKYNKIREETLSILNEYKFPAINVHLGYTPETISNSRFYNYMENPTSHRAELALGMLEIFDDFVNENEKTNPNGWLLFFEDDVRPINIRKDEDMTKLYNVPENAEFIRTYIGKNENSNLENMSYKVSFGGGLNHAFYISVSGCKKVLNYTKKYKWKYVGDIDLYKIAKYCGGFPTGYDGWSLTSSNRKNDISYLLQEDEKLNMYAMNYCIFYQTSNPFM